ncbi:hypothetical protein [Streptomyces sp. NPDC005760]|uniref:hypothetical protein n=1 Tax=Streptomyces sp. NPDC005760 TaxID=3156718 RepID=UPI0033F949BD
MPKKARRGGVSASTIFSSAGPAEAGVADLHLTPALGHGGTHPVVEGQLLGEAGGGAGPVSADAPGDAVTAGPALREAAGPAGHDGSRDARRLGSGPDRPEDPRPTALVAAALAGADAASTGWVACEGTVPLTVLLDRAMGAFTE